MRSRIPVASEGEGEGDGVAEPTRALVARVTAIRGGVVDPLAQAGLLVVDSAEISFEQALARTRRRSLAGYKYAYLDASRLYERIAQIGRERGARIHVGCFFNDRRVRARTSPAAPGGGVDAPASPAPGQIRAALPRTTIRWERQQDDPFEALFLRINDVPDSLDITALTDTHHLAPVDVEALRRGMEAVAVEAALDLAAPTRVRPAGGE